MSTPDKAAPQVPFGVGAVVDGKYRLLHVIGEGGWGVVFEAENTRTLKRVAIKVLRAKVAVDANDSARFEREAQAAGRIGSEHIVEVLDAGVSPEGAHYLVMELLAGESLAQRMQSRGRLEPIAAAKIISQTLAGLAAAHRAGITHRDLKPENLYLLPTRSGEDFVKILDFGISKFSVGPLANTTMTGSVVGSPAYMAPEQARGLKHIGPSADIHAVGVVLFECLTTRVPFEGDNFNDLMFKIVTAPRPSPRDFRPELDPELAAIVVRAIGTNPADRFPSAAAFRASLQEWLQAQGVPSAEAPELHQWLRATPDRHPHSAQQPVLALDATQPMLPTTPPGSLVSSAAQVRSGSKRTAVVAASVGIGVFLLAMALFGASRLLRNDPGAVEQGVPASGASSPSGAATLTATQKKSALVGLTVKATPPSARLFLDDVPLSGNPSVGQYPNDGQRHTVRAEALHYVTQTADVVFDDQARVVEINLTPKN
jgi:serine/threonine-protein kinase